MSTTFKVCNCNHSMPLSQGAGEKLGDALNAQMITVSSQLCGRDAQKYLSALGGGQAVVVGCTQERPLFDELARESNSVAPVRFVNLKENAGARGQAHRALPKMAALLADAALPAADPVPFINYASGGKVLIAGPADVALQWAQALQDQLQVHVLITDSRNDAALPRERRYPVVSGSDVVIQGWLGTFTVHWKQSNAIDLDLCVRCNTCIAACPEGAIDLLYQIDGDKCRRHGECVAACGEAGAIDFGRAAVQRQGEFDLILDLSAEPLIPLHQPPYGYFSARPHDKAAQFNAVLRLAQMTGEYEKPKYFQYREKLCTHSRNQKVGCKACIDICSAGAIRSDGDRIRVEPHLCAGCGACTTVCPSGAISYAYPAVPHTGKRLKTMLQTYAKAGGELPGILLHGESAADLLGELGRLAGAGKVQDGIPSRVIPLALHHAASAGLDVWLSAVAYGATSVAVLVTSADAPAYVAALKLQMSIAQMILSGLGYAGRHLQLIEADTVDALEHALQELPQGQVPAQAATFNAFAEKRTTLDFVFEHLYLHAPARNALIALPPGAPFGTLEVNADACTLCMSCTGACPTSALMSTPDRPQLRFIEKNCVQCGLCATTCPENAIALRPRLNLSDAAKQPVVLSETQPFECIRCHKPFSTVKSVEGMLVKLAGHAAFAGNLDRIRMCGDCRVIDMMQAKNKTLIADRQRVS